MKREEEEYIKELRRGKGEDRQEIRREKEDIQKTMREKDYTKVTRRRRRYTRERREADNINISLSPDKPSSSPLLVSCILI